ncbi:von_Willebrand factor type A domain-containing protein [Hexamita inflata]|uniref:von Willebrand factor type A domain-containing protein n=1 Tax=Hexamita inflata TaxID=28002 RepID=A0AA86QUD4_9EUKA|nr:von Willebrand factor type A domain-containing protein [Hexamita inflata]
MREDLIEVVAIIDKSGSMSSLAKDTIGGFNAFIQELAKSDKDVRVTQIQFNGECHIKYEHKEAKKCKKLNWWTYRPIGGTALIDALGQGIVNMQKYVDSLSEDQKPGKVSFFISTDGEENSSTHFSRQQVRSLVEKATDDQKWEFIFAGANIDAFGAGQDLGFKKENIANIENDGLGQQAMFEVMAQRQSSQCNDFDMQTHYQKTSKKLRSK